MLDLRRDFADGAHFAKSEVIAVSLAHAGAKSALLARAMVKEAVDGYSNVVQFSNPDGGKSGEYQGVGFQIEDVAGERLVPVMVARNVGSEAATVRARVPYTRTDSTTGAIELPQTRLRAGEIKLLDTHKVMQRSQQEQIQIAGIEVKYDTAPGRVIVNAHSVSVSGNQVFRVPLWDPLGQRSPTGGYPWHIEGTSTTRTYIKNITDREQYYVASLRWPNGEGYMIGMKPVAPHQTVEIDVKRLRDEQVPDVAGRMIPLDVASGQLMWSLKQVGSPPAGEEARQAFALIGRSEQVDVERGMSSNYACQNCCSDSYYSSFLSPGGSEVEVDTVTDLDAYQQDKDCYGTVNLPYERTLLDGPTSWSSSDTETATVNGSGVVTAVGAGETTIRASWTAYRYDLAFVPCWYFEGPPGPECHNCNEPVEVHPSPSAVQTVIGVSISGPQSVKDGSFLAPTFTLTPQGSTPNSYQWSWSAPSGVGNNPLVTFDPSDGATTTTNSHWFANPDVPCPVPPAAQQPPVSTDPYYNSVYTIRGQANFSQGAAHHDTTLTVNNYWNPAGRTAAPEISGGPTVGFNSSSNLWVVVNSGTLTRNAPVVDIFVPGASQFYNKTVVHENRHVQQYISGMNSDLFLVSSLMAQLAPLTDSTQAGLSARIAQAFSEWDSGQVAAVIIRTAVMESDAYSVSDTVLPQYAYQGCR